MCVWFFFCVVFFFFKFVSLSPSEVGLRLPFPPLFFPPVFVLSVLAVNLGVQSGIKWVHAAFTSSLSILVNAALS